MGGGYHSRGNWSHHSMGELGATIIGVNWGQPMATGVSLSVDQPRGTVYLVTLRSSDAAEETF